MSHFYTVVLIDRKKVPVPSRQEVESHLHDVMAPYCEHLEVEEHDEKCYCIGRIARDESREYAMKKAGSLDDFREKYHAIPEFERPDWKKFIEPFVVAENEKMTLHPERFKPDPKCEQCSGGGTYKSTYNQRSKWDWFVVGGRWTGALSGYEPWKDPKNMETCDICRGNGRRTDRVAIENCQTTMVIGKDVCQDEPEHPRFGQTGWCNGCDGRGKRVKFSYEPHEDDLMPASQIREAQLEKHMPYAVVTPDGEWWNQGRMGWWGMTSDDLKDEDWNAIVRDMVKTHSNCLAVVVDCHI